MTREQLFRRLVLAIAHPYIRVGAVSFSSCSNTESVWGFSEREFHLTVGFLAFVRLRIRAGLGYCLTVRLGREQRYGVNLELVLPGPGRDDGDRWVCIWPEYPGAILPYSRWPYNVR